MEAGWIERIRSAGRASPAELTLLVLVGVAIVGGSSLVFVRRSDPPPPPMEHRHKAAKRTPSALAGQPQDSTVVVHVAGMVAAPGVYELAKNSRIKDAIAAAGGPTDGADVNTLNLAAPLSDGQKITVARPGEQVSTGQAPLAISGVAGVGAGEPAAGDKINLNTATVAELDTLPSIGPVLAERIISFRQQKGRFTSVAQLKDIEGIGPKKYEGIRDLVTV